MSGDSLRSSLDEVSRALEKKVEEFTFDPRSEEVGRIVSIGQGIVWAEGLGRVGAEELVLLGRGKSSVTGVVLDLLPERVGITLLGSGERLSSGDEVVRTGRILDVCVGDALIGRVVDPLGRPLDGLGPVCDEERLPVERPAPEIIKRAPVEKPLMTGLKVVDAMIPVGRGQRELILGDRQTGKTAIAVDAILNQADKDCLCVYCAIAQRSSNVARVVDRLRKGGAMRYTVVVMVEGDAPPGMIYAAPYAASSMAEHFMSKGRDVLVVYDDLTRHAVAYRQMSLLLRRPPGREAFPGDIFYIHSRLLERATRLRPEFGGGSITALPIIETEAQNISAYIPTNLISITDGQIYLNPDLFQKGVLPAVDVAKSVSRVGGKAQFPAYRRVAGDLRLSYSQFQELEAFSRFGTRLDEQTKKALEHGRRVREALKQDRFSPLSAAGQIAVLYAVSKGLLDEVPLEDMAGVQSLIVDMVRARAGLSEEIAAAGADSGIWAELEALAREVLEEAKTSAVPGIPAQEIIGKKKNAVPGIPEKKD